MQRYISGTLLILVFSATRFHQKAVQVPYPMANKVTINPIGVKGKYIHPAFLNQRCFVVQELLI